MHIEVICTGDEVLTGKIVNTNFSYISQKLEDAGLSVRWETTVGDDRESLLQAFQRETDMFVASTLREDRSVVNLLNANYTFVNERLARHYGIPNIYGGQFRRVQITDDARRGLLGQASILTVTSYPNRTSAVQRGKWILTNLLTLRSS